MRRIVPIALLATSLLLSGCGSSKAKEQPAPTPDVLPRAATPDIWARRVVDFLLRPLNKDLVIIQNFDNPQIRIFIASRNATALRVIRKRLNDLGGCSTQLTIIGRPPAGAAAAYSRINDHLRKACKAYEDVAAKLLEATDLLASGNKDDASHGADMVATAHDPSARAARELTAGIKIAQGLAPFRRAGLQPSV
jgi:hypothetical protein